MTQINPPYNLSKIRPIKLMANNMPREFFYALNNYFEQMERILQQIYLRNGGSTGLESDDSIDLNFGAIIGDLRNELSSFDMAREEKSAQNYYSISSDRTTKGSEFIQVTADCTITLNSYPDDGETVSVQPTGNFTVTIAGQINGGTSIFMHKGYDLINLKYSVDAGEWVIV